MGIRRVGFGGKATSKRPQPCLKMVVGGFGSCPAAYALVEFEQWDRKGRARRIPLTQYGIDELTWTTKRSPSYIGHRPGWSDN
jgi:hypothetical protein